MSSEQSAAGRVETRADCGEPGSRVSAERGGGRRVVSLHQGRSRYSARVAGGDWEV